MGPRYRPKKEPQAQPSLAGDVIGGQRGQNSRVRLCLFLPYTQHEKKESPAAIGRQSGSQEFTINYRRTMSALVDSGAQLAGAVEEELKDSGGAELQQDSDSVLASASATLATLGDPRAPSPSTATTLPTEMEGPAGGAGVPVLVAAALMTGQDDHQHEDRMDTDNNNSPSHVPIDQQTHSAAFSVSSNSTLNQLGSNLGAARLAGTTGAGSVHSEEYSAFDDEDQDLDSEADDRHSLSPVSPNINHGTAGMQGDDSTPRSETVCWACRIRKLGCNRALPTCR